MNEVGFFGVDQLIWKNTGLIELYKDVDQEQG